MYGLPRFDLDIFGQIIATSHDLNDLTPNGGLVREIPLFQGNLGGKQLFSEVSLGEEASVKDTMTPSADAQGTCSLDSPASATRLLQEVEESPWLAWGW